MTRQREADKDGELISLGARLAIIYSNYSISRNKKDSTGGLRYWVSSMGDMQEAFVQGSLGCIRFAGGPLNPMVKRDGTMCWWPCTGREDGWKDEGAGWRCRGQSLGRGGVPRAFGSYRSDVTTPKSGTSLACAHTTFLILTPSDRQRYPNPLSRWHSAMRHPHPRLSP
jgi:hypothetical protein